MTIRRISTLVSIGSVLVVSSLSSVARADAPKPAESHAAAPQVAANSETGRDTAKAAESSEDEFKSVAITLNPLSLALMRIGANVEYLPAKHHAIIVNPYFWSTSVGGSSGSVGVETSYTSFGGELGYHFYTGSRGANGFFIGPSLILQQNSVTSKGAAAGASAESSSSITSYGAALDLGGQHVFQNGFTIGGGVGAMYLNASASDSASSSTFKVSGVLPRFLLTAGYSF